MSSQSRVAEQVDLVITEYRTLERRLTSVLQQTPLTIDSWRVLRVLRNADGVSMKDILDATVLPPASATRAVDALVSLDFAFRRPDESDRRVVQVRITTSGTEMLSEIDLALAEEFSSEPTMPLVRE